MGQVSIQLGKERFTSLREGLAGIKSIKLHQAETFFHERFRVASEEFALLKPRYQMIALSPKYVIELIGIGGILLFTISLISWNDDVSQTLPLLSLYAFAGYRLIPALQKIFVAASRMKPFQCQRRFTLQRFDCRGRAGRDFGRGNCTSYK